MARLSDLALLKHAAAPAACSASEMCSNLAAGTDTLLPSTAGVYASCSCGGGFCSSSSSTGISGSCNGSRAVAVLLLTASH